MTSSSTTCAISAESASVLGNVAWQPADHRLWPAIEALASGNFDLLSCDFFDTLLWRVTPHPSDAFPFVYHKLRERGALSPHVTIQAFDLARKLAEQRARDELFKCSGSGEVSLKEIYAKFPAEFAVGMEPAGLAEVEERAEHVLLRRDESFVRLLGWAKKCGIPYVIVSDTFYSAQALVGMMKAAGWPEGLFPDRVFVSSEARRCKTQGLLGQVAKSMNMDPERILHVGDNYDADVNGPHVAGMAGVLVDRSPHPVTAVEIVEPKRDVARRGASLDEHADYGLAALRRRLAFESEIRCPNEALRPYWLYGALTFGPVLTAMGQWLRARVSKTQGADKLYCLQREGDFFCRLLAVLRKSSPAQGNIIPMQTFSLPASRLAMMKCVVDGGDAESLAAFASGLPVGATVADMASHLGIAGEPLGSYSTMLELPVVAAASQDIRLLCGYLAGSPRLGARINELAARRRERFVRIALEGAVRDESRRPFILTDLGYNGTIQTLIARIFRLSGVSRRVMGLYMVTNARIIASSMEACGPAFGYLADAGSPVDFAAIDLRNHPVLEQSLMPNMGSVCDFGEDGPVREILAISPAQQRQQEAVQEGMLACADVWPRLCAELGLRFDPDDETLKSRLRTIAERAMGEPTDDELKLLGGWHHEVNLGSAHTAPLTGNPERYAATRYLPLMGNLQDTDLWLNAKLKQADPGAHGKVLDVMRATGAHRCIALSYRDKVSFDFFAYLDEDAQSGEAQEIRIVEGGKGIQIAVNEQGLIRAHGVFPVSPRQSFRSVVVKFAPVDGLFRLDGAELLWSREMTACRQIQEHRRLAQGSAAYAGGADGLSVEGAAPITGQLYSGRKGLVVRLAVPPSAGRVGCLAFNAYLAFVKDKESGFEDLAKSGAV